jgi:hypothetical protein
MAIPPKTLEHEPQGDPDQDRHPDGDGLMPRDRRRAEVDRAARREELAHRSAHARWPDELRQPDHEQQERDGHHQFDGVRGTS